MKHFFSDVLFLKLKCHTVNPYCFFFPATPTACGNPPAGDWIWATAGTYSTAVAMQDPQSTVPQRELHFTFILKHKHVVMKKVMTAHSSSGSMICFLLKYHHLYPLWIFMISVQVWTQWKSQLMSYYENSFVLAESLKRSQGAKGVWGYHLENHWFRLCCVSYAALTSRDFIL